VSTYIDRLCQLQVEINSELNDLKGAIGNRPSEFALFEKLFNNSWKKLKSSFGKFLREFGEESRKYVATYERELKEEITGFRSNFGIPSLESIDGLTHTSSAQDVYHNFLKQMRIQFLRKLSSLDDVLEKLAERMREDVVDILIVQGELLGLSDKGGASSLEKLIDLLPHESECLKHGFNTLLNFDISYSTFLLPQIRDYLNKAISELEKKPLSPTSKSVEEIRQVIMISYEEIISGCEEVITNTIQVPPRLFYTTVEEFIDNIIYSEDAQSEWRVLLYENRYQVWNVFNEMREFDRLKQKWQQLITNVEAVNANIEGMP